MKITAKRLHSKGACTYQVKVFDKEWPNGAQTTLKNLKRAVELGLELDFLVDEFLTGKQMKEFYKKEDDLNYSEKTAQVLFDILKRKK